MRNPSIVQVSWAALTLGALTVYVAGCSSSDPGALQRRGGPASAGSGTSVVGQSPGSMAQAGGKSSAPAGSVLPPAAAAGGGATQPPVMPIANTAITREPIAIDECGAMNPGGVAPEVVQQLKAGGAPGAAKYLYPYEGTVFPRGMLAPDVMWDGPPAEAVYIHIKSMIFEYWGCLVPMQPNRITLPQQVWENAGQRSFGSTDPYLIELTAMSGGVVTGPISTRVNIAQAAIKGSIYYNTYRSNLAGQAPGGVPGGGIPGGGFPGGGFPGGGIGGGGSNGIVVRIPSGKTAEVFGQTDCNGCHSVSAQGSTLLAQSVAGGALVYELSNGAAPTATTAQQSGCWVGLYPDGSAALSMSSVIDVARAGIFGGLGGGGSSDATLYDTKTGQKLMSTGIPPGALMPFFSPDGTYLVFNDYAIDQAHGIALTRYNTATHTASDYQVLLQAEAGSTLRPGWPFVLPDNGGVVFVNTDDGDFTGGGVGVSGEIQPGQAAPFSELSVIDLKSKSVSLLAKAMGFNTPADAMSGTTYLPFGAEDIHHAYYPTVSPVGAGGYFWVFFDSVRHYGSLGVQRQLWGAAIDISADGSYTTDPSHPAFYVSGQEFGTGNHRAFAALDPCRKDGDTCTSGIDCCGGFCYLNDNEIDPKGTCGPKMMMCSRADERCSTASDCCGSAVPLTCIAGYCAVVRGPD